MSGTKATSWCRMSELVTARLKFHNGSTVLITLAGVEGILKSKGYSAADIVFPIIASFMNWVTGYSDETKLTKDHKMYSDLVNYLMFNPCGIIDSSLYSYNLKENI